ncbi:prolyl-4 hydroxylase alpha subunit [Micractinium conductrix]|uniref:Prolyl-4 hydroxylase alpha subunit n=1 Tax=Micractinium conductrix TaxID=554055 RepID=A0A2P6VGX4_9CHLO|nr:prolyl-4 hydroxylase alpha subunit [Micractinium conductrix]|eukprot:PSC73342.1 prolyl-4 hydroxylase alpha subunit [Micractinium conductrix]
MAGAAAAGGGDWAAVFEAERQGALRGATGPLTPELVLAELRRSHAAEQQLGAQLARLATREAGLAAAAAASAAENQQLRSALHSARAVADPSLVQLRQLLLDPAVNREVSRLRTELEGARREVAAAQAELRARQFGREPLVGKLEALQDENSDLRRQVGDGRVAQLERTVAAAREQLEESRRVTKELEQQAVGLDQQAEALADALALAQRGTAPPRPRPACTLGALDEAPDDEEGAPVWRLDATELASALKGSDGGGQRCAASSAFSLPPAVLPPAAACKRLLARQRWRLLCSADGAGGALGVALQWLGGPCYPSTAGNSFCGELKVDVRCVGGGGGQPLLHKRAWLLHAFNDRTPEAALPGLVAGAELQGGGEGLELEVRVSFESAAVHVQSPIPGLVVAEEPHLVLKVSEDPCLLLADRFLSPQECEAVRALGGPYLKRSKVSAGDETPLRTSWGTFLTGQMAVHPVAVHLDDRVEELTRLACKIERRAALALSEATQIVKYDRGQFYALHMDNRAGDCARRAATVMIYLSDVEAGGATSFPRSSGYPLRRALQTCAAGWRNEPAAPPGTPTPADGGNGNGGRGRSAGLRIAPVEGRAVIFWSRMADGEEDKCSIHEAEKVEAGTKWIATRWCREAQPAAQG